MEIEDKRARSGDWVDIREASKSPGVYEDDDGDLLLINEEGGATSLNESRTSNVWAYTEPLAWDEGDLFRKLAAKIVIIGTMLLALGCTPAQDNGFMTGCDTPGGGIDLTGECYPIQWPSVPLTVYSNGERAALDRAVERWENRRPFHHQDLFTVVEDITNVDVLIQTDACCSDTALGDAALYRFGDGRMSADIRVFRTAFDSQTECVLFHELGHVLGLAHDDYGPMRPGGCAIECDPGDTECTDDGLTPVDLRVTDGDHRRLNDVY